MVSTDGFYNFFNLCGAGLLAGIFIAAGVAHTHSAVAEFHVAAHALACRCVYLVGACSIAPALPLLTPHPGILMFTPITPEELVAELYSRYGYSVPLDYAINYIDINEYATVDDFHLWLQTFENDRQ